MICLGLWPGAPALRLERIAANIADFEIADNVGAIVREPLLEGGPDGYRSTLPIHAIRDRLLEAGIPAQLSGTAGQFLCNACMYHALHAGARLSPRPPCGFLHLPSWLRSPRRPGCAPDHQTVSHHAQHACRSSPGRLTSGHGFVRHHPGLQAARTTTSVRLSTLGATPPHS